MRTAVLVHGAYHGSWCWEALTPHLDDLGVRWVAVDLPLQSLSGDAAVVRTALDEVSGGTVLVGHSYGGMVITQAGTHPSVERLLYLAAVAPDVGESARTALKRDPAAGTALSPALDLDAEGRFNVVVPELAARLFYGRCEAGVADAALTRLRPTSSDALTEPVSDCAWRSRPATYVVCSQDEIIAAREQRELAARASAEVVTLTSDHSPFYCQPEQLARVLHSLAL